MVITAAPHSGAHCVLRRARSADATSRGLGLKAGCDYGGERQAHLPRWPSPASPRLRDEMRLWGRAMGQRVPVLQPSAHSGRREKELGVASDTQFCAHHRSCGGCPDAWQASWKRVTRCPCSPLSAAQQRWATSVSPSVVLKVPGIEKQYGPDRKRKPGHNLR